MQTKSSSPQEVRLNAMGQMFIAIDERRVNLDDLVEATDGMPGGIVRCVGNPNNCFRIVDVGAGEQFGCVAGWISEED